MTQDQDPCPACGALPCDWVNNPHVEAGATNMLIAELAASVTELLEPLERASAAMVGIGQVADENAEVAFDRARAAIAKATLPGSRP